MPIKNDANNEKLWTAGYITVFSITLLVSIVMQMMNPSIPLYLKSLGGAAALGGLANGTLAISALIFRPISGIIIDSKGRQKLILIGSVIFAIGILVINFIPMIPAVILGRFIQGAGFSMVTTACGTVVTDIVPHKKLNEGIGYMGLTISIATALGPSIALFIIGQFNFWWLFNIAFVTVIVVGILGSMLTYEKKRHVSTDNIDHFTSKIPPVKRTFLSMLFERTAVKPSIVQFFAAFSMAAITFFLAYYGLEIGIKGIGSYFTASAAAMVISRLVVAKLLHRYAEKNILSASLVLAIVVHIFLAFSTNLYQFVILGIFNGFAQGISYSVLNILAVKNTPLERRGVANATYYASIDLGMALGGIFWGIVADVSGFRFVYIGTSMCVAVALALTIRLIGNTKDRSAQT